jgi:hypothetical protein
MQQQQLEITSGSAGGARVGLARSRHVVNEPPPKKSRVKRSFAHEQTTVRNVITCNHCHSNVTDNITRRKEHLLKCNNFLGTPAAAEAAQNDKELREAVAEHR